MQQVIRGIVLRRVKYGETSMIVDLFTESHGRHSFLTSLSRSRREVRGASFWQPLTLVEFTAEIRPCATRLPRPREVRAYHLYTSIPHSPVKSSIVLFLAEFLSGALRGEEQDTPLYEYVETSLRWFDTVSSPAQMANFHLAFLIHLSRLVGIYPNLENPQPFFDLLAGSYCDRAPLHRHYLKGEEAHALPTLFRMDWSTAHLFRFSRPQRWRILQVLCEYYSLHLPEFPELKSLEVLREMFD